MKNSVQNDLFRLLKDSLPPYQSLVDEVAELLNVSTDSAYRRLRGDTALTLDEAAILCKRFGLSLDRLILSTPGSVNFAYRAVSEGPFDFDTWLGGIVNDLQRIHSAPEREIIYYAKDLPIFHFFLFPEIARFKVFFWLRTVYDHPSLKDQLFSLEGLKDDSAGQRMKALELYTRIPTRELWSDETINTTLQQIAYYVESGLFARMEDAHRLCDRVGELVTHIRRQAETGCKFIPGREPAGDADNFRLYRNEVLIGDNTIVVKAGGGATVYVPHNVLNYLVTSHEGFTQRTLATLDNLMRKAELISGSNEKARSKYFNHLAQRVQAVKAKLG